MKPLHRVRRATHPTPQEQQHMALVKAGNPAPPVTPGEIPEVPTSITRDRWDRPLIVPATGGNAVAYTRASTLGKTIEDSYNLSKWGQRNVALGLSRRPDLVALAAAVRTNEGDDRAPLDDVCDKAHEAAKGDRGANVGTALHALSERRDAGEDLAYLPADLAAALDAYTRCMAPLEVLASETFVVNDELQTAGTFDRVVSPRGELVAPDGTRFGPGDTLVLDLKTGKAESARYWGAGYAVQQAVYGRGMPYRAGAGRMPWSAVLGADIAPSRAWALILHVPSDSPADSGLVWVDLDIGFALAELCVEVRSARKVKGLFAPCHIEAPVGAVAQVCTCSPHTGGMPCACPPDATARVPAQVVKTQLIGELRAAADENVLNALWESNQAVWDADCTRMVRARLAELDAA